MKSGAFWALVRKSLPMKILLLMAGAASVTCSAVASQRALFRVFKETGDELQQKILKPEHEEILRTLGKKYYFNLSDISFYSTDKGYIPFYGMDSLVWESTFKDSKKTIREKKAREYAKVGFLTGALLVESLKGRALLRISSDTASYAQQLYLFGVLSLMGGLVGGFLGWWYGRLRYTKLWMAACYPKAEPPAGDLCLDTNPWVNSFRRKKGMVSVLVPGFWEKVFEAEQNRATR